MNENITNKIDQILLYQEKQNKEINSIKNLLKLVVENMDSVIAKLEEFEIVLDAAEIIEDHMEEAEKYNTEWNPYDDEDYEAEEYEDYDQDDDEF